jgi:very-short-patch-repair endonuclease
MEGYDLYLRIIEQDLGVKITPEYKFHSDRRWRFDYAIVDERIAIEIEGGLWLQGRHNRPLSMIKDFEKYNNAAMLGWRILKYTPQQIVNTRQVGKDVKNAIENAICISQQRI